MRDWPRDGTGLQLTGRVEERCLIRVFYTKVIERSVGDNFETNWCLQLWDTGPLGHYARCVCKQCFCSTLCKIYIYMYKFAGI